MKRDRRGGFAVVLMVALLAAVVLLLLALAALARNELRASARRTAGEQARRDALLGLHVALGRLQAAAGPDARSTATAEALGAANTHWTGVWADDGDPVWLVSGAVSGPEVAVVTAGDEADGIVLVGSGTSTDSAGTVAAPWEAITVAALPGLGGERTVGRFAYWIGDEGVKGHVGIADRVDSVAVPAAPATDDPVTNAAERNRLRQLLAHRPGNDALADLQLGAEDETGSAERWMQFAAALTYAQLRFQDLGEAQATTDYRAYLRKHFHDLTIHSAGVLADAAAGGLRANYSDLASDAVPAAVVDLERYRPVEDRLPLSAGAAPADGPTAQVKPILTEWTLDFVPYREDGGTRLLVGCRLRLELWNPFNLPLAFTPAGTADLRVRVDGLPAVAVTGPAGVAGSIDLGAVLGAEPGIAVDVAGDLGAGEVVVVETVVATGWDSGLVVVDPTPSEADDDVLQLAAAAASVQPLTMTLSTDSGDILTALSGFPVAAFARSGTGNWATTAPFVAGDDPLVRLGVSFHFRLSPERSAWRDWVAPAEESDAGPDLKAAQLSCDATVWDSAGTNPVANAQAVAAQFAASELFATGAGFTAYDFTVQRNLSVAALAQLAEPGTRALGIGNPWGGERNAVFDEAFFNPVPADWPAGGTLPNVRHRIEETGTAAPTAAELGGWAAARYLVVDGMFNVNSVSPEAWTVVLGRTVLGWTDAGGTAHDLENPFFVFGQSAPFAAEAARGVRHFPDAAIRRLAEEIVARIAARESPFRSMAEFVNSGVLQAAIDAAGLNSDTTYCDDLGGVVAEPYTANYLTQAAVLNTLAPVLAVRSDTFLVRVAAEALNPALPDDDPERVAARAWCEALVQRCPEYVDPAEDAAVWPATLATNSMLGRRFRIVQFRWLGPDDI